VGKAVLQLALQFPIKRAVGIELARSRHDIAAAALEWMASQNAPFLSSQPPELVCGSFTDPIYADATHVFANSLLFGPELEQAVADVLTRSCPVLFQAVATTRLPMPPLTWRLLPQRLQLPVSWQVRRRRHTHGAVVVVMVFPSAQGGAVGRVMWVATGGAPCHPRLHAACCQTAWLPRCGLCVCVLHR
jgi:hypothetical protein